MKSGIIIIGNNSNNRGNAMLPSTSMRIDLLTNTSVNCEPFSRGPLSDEGKCKKPTKR